MLWLIPAMVVLEEFIVESFILRCDRVSLLSEASGYVTFVGKVLRADLSDMKVNQERVVPVQFL